MRNKVEFMRNKDENFRYKVSITSNSQNYEKKVTSEIQSDSCEK